MYEALTPIRPRSVPAFVQAKTRLWPWLVVALVTLAMTLILLAVVPRPLSPDISGQLWIARNLRQGARLYIDINEINPPLWFWMAMPLDALAELTSVRPEDIVIAAVGVAAAISLLATDRLMAHHPSGRRMAFLVYGAAVLLVMPLRDLEQREQLALFAALPYVALIAERRERRHVPIWLALSVGIGSAAGFALKHYFVGVPLILELWLALELRRDWRPVRSDTLALVLSAIAYVVAILIVTPGYFEVSVPELRLAYGATGAVDLPHLFRPAQPIWLLIIAGIWLQRSTTRRPLPPLAAALLVAALGFAMAWGIQHKGWPYQSIATTGMLSLAMAAAFLDGEDRTAGRPRPLVIASLVAPLLLFLAPTQETPAPDSDITPALADLGPGDTVAILSREGRTAWPSTVGRGLTFSGRWGTLWTLAAVDANTLGAHDPRVDALGRRMVRELVSDYRCMPPKRIIFYPGRATQRVTTASDNPLRYFLDDSGFRALIGHYRRLDQQGSYDAFTLVDPIESAPAGLCRRGRSGH